MPESKAKKPEYKEFAHTFVPFDGDEEIRVAHKFKRPTVARIDRTVTDLRKSPTRAFKNLLVELVDPDEKEELEKNLENFPGLPNTFGNAILTRMGFGELGN